jgi:hypothetical protein
MDLSAYISEYQAQPYCLTPRQKEYLSALTESETPLVVISEILQEPITSWNQLKRNQVSTAIYRLLARRKCSILQQQLLQTIFTSLDEVSGRLNRQIKSWEDLSSRDFKILLRSPERFHLVPKDHPVKITTDYEVGWQETELCKDGRMEYLKFYDFMMLDFDGILREELSRRLSQYPEMIFRIYQTHQGFHVFVMSRRFHHGDWESYQLMTTLGCDRFYILFSFKYGYKIRLSPKKDREEKFLAKYLETVGDARQADPKCVELMHIHDDYVEPIISE